MKKLLNLILPLVALTLFTGCQDDELGGTKTNFFSFNTKEMIVEVTPKTTSFRIEGYWTENNEEQSTVRYYSPNSTAKPGEHFIYDYDTENTAMNTMLFTASDKKTCYHDITIIPENITTEVTISFSKFALVDPDETANKDLINEMKVILRPAK